MKPRILVINGPNLNLLGTREPDVYGRSTLDEIARTAEANAARLGLEVDWRQSNSEGLIIDWIHEARGGADALVVNAGAYAHTSLAIHDALKAFDGPIVEVHLTNVFRREPARHHSWVAPVAVGVICGFGGDGYRLALEALAARLRSTPA